MFVNINLLQAVIGVIYDQRRAESLSFSFAGNSFSNVSANPWYETMRDCRNL